ncbi:MAG: metalloregulator ArsR/SmtB family transcription factor [Pseudomonadota bacterium]
MPSRIVVAKELSEIYKILSHPDRIRLIEELRQSERDVNSLHEALELPATRVSQHLALLRAHRVVEERREGRHVFYHLTQPELADWIVDGLQFVEMRMLGTSEQRKMVSQARKLWSANGESA